LAATKSSVREPEAPRSKKAEAPPPAGKDKPRGRGDRMPRSSFKKLKGG